MTSHLRQMIIILFTHLLSVFLIFCVNFLVPDGRADFYKPLFIPALPPSRSVKLHFCEFLEFPRMINLFLKFENLKKWSQLLVIIRNGKGPSCLLMKQNCSSGKKKDSHTCLTVKKNRTEKKVMWTESSVLIYVDHLLFNALLTRKI